MAAAKSSFLDKVLGRIGRLDAEGLQTVVQRLARERRFLEILFNTIEDGLLVADETGRVLYYNQAVTRLIGLPPGGEGRHVRECLPELDWERLAHSEPGGRRVVRHEFEVHYPRLRFLRLYAAPLDGETTDSSGVALILHDATEARQQTFDAIESERIQALTLLAASVAHEIGNPLNALHIHLQLMERQLKKLRDLSAVPEPTPTAVRRRGAASAAPDLREAQESVAKLDEYLHVAKGEIHRLDYIITQFLQALRPVPPQLQLASLNDVVGKTLDLLRPELDNREIRVESRLARQLPPTPMDPVQLQQVLVNLVKNAMQAMTKGGRLTLRTGSGTDGAWVSVTDTGRGIPQEQINRLFEPCYTTKRKGSGLGLMIVLRIVRAHQGRIEVESQPGRGSTFRVWLPLHEPRPHLLEAPAPAPPEE